MVKTLADRKRKWLDFMDPGSDERTIFLVNTDAEGPGPRPLPQPRLLKERVEWAYENYGAQLSRMEWLRDDRVPALEPYTGTEIFAEAFGCKVHYPDNDMPFALPKYFSAAEAAEMKVPGVHDTPLHDLFETARRLRQRAGEGAALRLPDVQSPLDIAALILYKEEFYSAMVEAPELIRELAAKAQALLTAFLDEWFREFGSAYIAHFPDYYMEGGVTLSEDEIGAFSPAMFNDFCLGTLNALSDRYGGIGIHTCADSEHQWENIKKVKGLRLLNFVRSADGIRESFECFGGAVAHWPIVNGSPDLESDPQWLSACPDNVHAVITYRAKTRRAAAETARRAEELCARRRAANV